MVSEELCTTWCFYTALTLFFVPGVVVCQEDVSLNISSKASCKASDYPLVTDAEISLPVHLSTESMPCPIRLPRLEFDEFLDCICNLNVKEQCGISLDENRMGNVSYSSYALFGGRCADNKFTIPGDSKKNDIFVTCSTTVNDLSNETIEQCENIPTKTADWICPYSNVTVNLGGNWVLNVKEIGTRTNVTVCSYMNSSDEESTTTKSPEEPDETTTISTIQTGDNTNVTMSTGVATTDSSSGETTTVSTTSTTITTVPTTTTSPTHDSTFTATTSPTPVPTTSTTTTPVPTTTATTTPVPTTTTTTTPVPTTATTTTPVPTTTTTTTPVPTTTTTTTPFPTTTTTTTPAPTTSTTTTPVPTTSTTTTPVHTTSTSSTLVTTTTTTSTTTTTTTSMTTTSRTPTLVPSTTTTTTSTPVSMSTTTTTTDATTPSIITTSLTTASTISTTPYNTTELTSTPNDLEPLDSPDVSDDRVKVIIISIVASIIAVIAIVLVVVIIIRKRNKQQRTSSKDVEHNGSTSAQPESVGLNGVNNMTYENPYDSEEPYGPMHLFNPNLAHSPQFDNPYASNGNTPETFINNGNIFDFLDSGTNRGVTAQYTEVKKMPKKSKNVYSKLNGVKRQDRTNPYDSLPGHLPTMEDTRNLRSEGDSMSSSNSAGNQNGSPRDTTDPYSTVPDHPLTRQGTRNPASDYETPTINANNVVFHQNGTVDDTYYSTIPDQGGSVDDATSPYSTVADQNRGAQNTSGTPNFPENISESAQNDYSRLHEVRQRRANNNPYNILFPD